MIEFFTEKDKPLVLKEIKKYVKEQRELNEHLKDADVSKFLEYADFLILALAEWSSADAKGDITDSDIHWGACEGIKNRLTDLLFEGEEAPINEVKEKIGKLEAKLRNHRHNVTEKISGKAEY